MTDLVVLCFCKHEVEDFIYGQWTCENKVGSHKSILSPNLLVQILVGDDDLGIAFRTYLTWE